ncbi:replication factor C subunit 3-like [Salvia divinorum]|uniref:Replication factor C subunit 3-like n=1 Tax=Salvia divinorum TaxID=28513 RepID=A0ABD1G7E1_SALDI
MSPFPVPCAIKLLQGFPEGGLTYQNWVGRYNSQNCKKFCKRSEPKTALQYPSRTSNTLRAQCGSRIPIASSKRRTKNNSSTTFTASKNHVNRKNWASTHQLAESGKQLSDPRKNVHKFMNIEEFMARFMSWYKAWV